MTEQDKPLTPEQEAQLDKLLDGEMNPFMARAAVRGYFEGIDTPDEQMVDEVDPDRGEESQEEPPLPDPHHRVAPHNAPSGHVRDFHDGGRSDEDRIDYFGEPQSPTARQARQAALPYLQEEADDILQARLMKGLGEGLTHAQIQAIWEKRMARRRQNSGDTDKAD
jgi:hypothetical protein